MIQDGAYRRLLDYYYASEAPLPPELNKVFAIARAVTAPEKAAVKHVLSAHFELDDDGYHNRRADKELSIAVPKITKMAAVARENGKKGGNPQKKAQYNEPGALYAFRIDDTRVKVGITKWIGQRRSALRTQHGGGDMLLHVHVGEMGKAEAAVLAQFERFADGEILIGAPIEQVLTAIRSFGSPQPGPQPNPQPNTAVDNGGTSLESDPNPQPDSALIRRQPPTTNHQNLNHRFPGISNIPDPPDTATAEAEINCNPETLARVVDECRRYQVEGAHGGNAVIRRWVRDGASAGQVMIALAEARKCKPAPAMLPVGYVAKILERIVAEDAEARRVNEARAANTQQLLTEQRTQSAAPAPPGFFGNPKAASA